MISGEENKTPTQFSVLVYSISVFWAFFFLCSMSHIHNFNGKKNIMDDFIWINIKTARTNRSLTSNRRMSTIHVEFWSIFFCEMNSSKSSVMIWARYWDEVLYCYCTTVYSSLNWVESMLIIIKMKITVKFVVVCANMRACVNNVHAIYLSCPVGFVVFFFFFFSLIDRCTQCEIPWCEWSKSCMCLCIDKDTQISKTQWSNLLKSKGIHNLKWHIQYTYSYQRHW